MKDEKIKSVQTEAGTAINFEQSTEEDDEFEFPIIFY